MSTTEEEQQEKLFTIVREAIERDEALRQKFEIGDKFRFVRERLKEVLTYLEAEESAKPVIKKEISTALQEGEVAVYVYLYNAKGLVLRNWLNMLVPKVFYEYSVNRPIYANKEHIEAYIASKAEKQQHAYLTVAIKATEILQTPTENIPKDALDHPLIKVKEGSLKIEKLINFTHNGNVYRLNVEGEFVKV